MATSTKETDANLYHKVLISYCKKCRKMISYKKDINICLKGGGSMQGVRDMLQKELSLNLVTDATVMEAEKQLSQDDFHRYMMLFNSSKKSSGVTWALWFFLGGFYIHMFYLGLFDQKHNHILRVIVLVASYFLLGIPLIVIWIYDAIKMSSFIKEANNREKAKILISLLPNDSAGFNGNNASLINSNFDESNKTI